MAALPAGCAGDDVHQRQEPYLVCGLVDLGSTFKWISPLISINADVEPTQNMHELACVSGIAAAYRLGADYEKFDDFAEDFFKKYLLISHGVIYRGGKKQQ